MRRALLFTMLVAATVMPAILCADAKYYRYSDNRQLYYTENNRIYRYSDNRQLFYIENGRIYRYSDNRQLYYIENDRIYRYSDNRQVLYYDGDDLKLTVFMVLMLADM